MSSLGMMKVIDMISTKNTSIFKSPRFLSPEKLWEIFVLRGVDLDNISTDQYDALCIRIAKYATYHYYRSNDWVVRPGSKMGSDWLLYSYGPPIDHSVYSVIVCVNMTNVINSPYKIPLKMNQVPVTDILRSSRVSNSVKKTLILSFVIPKTTINLSQLRDPMCISKLSIWENRFTRLCPSMCRD